MKNKKPVTTNMKLRVNKLYVYMVDGKTVTKDDVCKVCGVTNERSARDIISVLAGIKPVISTSDGKGYRLALTAKDVEDVIHCWKELDSRQQELEKRKAPLIAFCEKMKKVG